MGECVDELVEGVHAVICVGGEELSSQSVRKCGSASPLARTCYNELARTRAGVVVNGALDCPCAALLCKTLNFVWYKVGDEDLVGELDDFAWASCGPEPSKWTGEPGR